MLRSLFTGVSGLSAHQQMLDVTSNNIANVNTTGFKASSSVFEDTLSQTLSGGGAPVNPGTATAIGGTNSTQIGLGVKLASTDLNFTQGSAEATGVASNLMINGDGFFSVEQNGQVAYTRAGSFKLDEAGQFVSPDGSVLEGWTGAQLPLPALPATPVAPAPLQFPALVDGVTYSSYSIDSNGNINGVLAANGTTVTLGKVGMATFSNPNGLEKSGDTQFLASASSGNAIYGSANAGGIGSVTSGYLEMSNVNLAQEFTNLIISERGFQANSKVITTSDEVLQTLVNLKN